MKTPTDLNSRMRGERKQRERLAVDARLAIQMARFYRDSPAYADPDQARDWAERAATLATEFREAVRAETEPT